MGADLNCRLLGYELYLIPDRKVTPNNNDNPGSNLAGISLSIDVPFSRVFWLVLLEK